MHIISIGGIIGAVLKNKYVALILESTQLHSLFFTRRIDVIQKLIHAISNFHLTAGCFRICRIKFRHGALCITILIRAFQNIALWTCFGYVSVQLEIFRKNTATGPSMIITSIICRRCSQRYGGPVIIISSIHMQCSSNLLQITGTLYSPRRLSCH